MWSAVGQHSWVLGNRGLNQITAQVNHLDRLSDVDEHHHGRALHARLPERATSSRRACRSRRSTPAPAAPAERSPIRYVIQIKDDVSLQSGHPRAEVRRQLQLPARHRHPERERALRDAHLLRRSVGDPQQQQRALSAGLPDARASCGSGSRPTAARNGATRIARRASSSRPGSRTTGASTPRLTLNLGVRYDIDFNFYDQENCENNATRLALEAIGNPYGGLPKTPTKNISPRVGFAYDLSGDGRRVLRGGYGLYFDQFNINGGNVSDISSQNQRPLNALATLTNTAIGVGQLATYRFGIDPLPPQPTEGEHAAAGSTGQWLGSGHHGSAHPPGAHRLRPRAGGQHDGLGRLHARRGTERAPDAEHQSDRQRRSACWRPTSCACSAGRTTSAT